MNQQGVKNDPALPVADRPFWDQDQSEDEDQEVQSVANSFVLLKSLKQSRERWLYHTFPKFSSRGRGSKAADIPTPPPHTIQNRGRCVLEIGPHLFHDTILYEVHYLPSLPPSAPTPQAATANPYWQSTVPYGSPYSLNRLSSTPLSAPDIATALTPKPRSEIVSTPLISSLTEASITPVTPSLINQVNTAAASNPILANLLQLAAANKASEDQLKTLGLLIQSLANMESSLSTPKASPADLQPSDASSYSTHPPVKEFDIVIEFSEAVNDRWLIPRKPVYVQRLPVGVASKTDIDLTTCIPDTGRVAGSDSQSMTEAHEIAITLRLKDAPFTLWDTISRWAGTEEKMEAHKKYLDSLVPPQRLYLGLQVSSASLLTQLQAACAPPYVMRPLRQGPTPVRQKRTYASRRGDRSGQSRAEDASTGGVVTKKSRASLSKSSSATPIQCLSCKQTDVPLIMGGRFCRPCAAAAGHPQHVAVQAIQPSPL